MNKFYVYFDLESQRLIITNTEIVKKSSIYLFRVDSDQYQTGIQIAKSFCAGYMFSNSVDIKAKNDINEFKM